MNQSNTKPLITVVIPTYKRPEFLKKAVTSVLNQSFTQFEILIMNNASGEETDKVIGELMKKDHRIQATTHKINIGAVANFQAGLMLTATPYVCFLPDDDVYLPHFFERALAIFEANRDISLCAGENLLTNDLNEIIIPETNPNTLACQGLLSPPEGLFAYLKAAHKFLLPAILFNTHLLKATDGFNLKLPIEFDTDIISKMAIRHPVYFLNKPVYICHITQNSLGQSTHLFAREKEKLMIHETLRSFSLTEQQANSLTALLHHQHVKLLSTAYGDYCAKKEFKQAALCAEKISHLTQTEAKRWKRKRRQAQRYAYFPWLFSIYSHIKHVEKKIRKLLLR